MYNANIAQIANHQKILESGMRLLESLTLSIKSAIYKKKDDNEGITYFLNLIKKGSTVLDIGIHTEDYLYLMLKMAKLSGMFIAFESDPEIYQYLSEKKKVLKLKNVSVEQLASSQQTEKENPGFLLRKKNSATVIDFRTQISGITKTPQSGNSLDNYCISNNIKPDFLKISAKGNELALLNGAIGILKKYKPKILIECEDRYAGRTNILKTFKFLADANYSGYFILDVMKIPVINFDFNIYQNPLSNFYCKDFIFE